MRSNFGFFFLILLPFFLPLPTFSHNLIDLSTQSYKITIDSSIVHLPHYFIQPQSDTIFVNDILQRRDHDYNIDYQWGKIIFLAAYLDSIRVRVKYRRFPFSLQPQYYHRQPVLFRAIEDTIEFSDLKAEKESGLSLFDRDLYSETTLQVGGSKTVGIQIGSNRDLALEQSLRVNVFGQITRNVTVRAMLSDQNTPLQSEGTTEEISDLDKVLIEIEGTHFSTTLGDYDLKLQQSEFANISRTLQGVKGGLNFSRYSATVAAAVSDGQFRTQEFRGQDGKQGPYQLFGKNGESGIIVIGGSESIWVDGELMRRGESNDYIIEYSAGEITFMPGRLITSESRLIVDFEYTTQRYKKGFYAASGRVTLFDQKVEIGATYLTEADNKNKPLEVDLSDEHKKVLAEAGDNPEQAYMPGWNLVGMGEGNYFREDTIFVWAGRDSGDFDVQFTRVADGLGDYVYAGGDSGFKYLGLGFGNYIAYLLLPLPESQNVADVLLKFRPSTWLQLQSEVALSQSDLNTFSDKDDGDNNDIATVSQLRLSPDLNRWGQLEVRAKYRTVGENFYSLGRIVDANFNRNWGSENIPKSKEKTVEVVSNYKPHKLLNLYGFYGDMERGSTFSSLRREFGFYFSPKKIPTIKYNFRRVDTNITEDGKRETGERKKEDRFPVSGFRSPFPVLRSPFSENSFWRTNHQVRTVLERWRLQPSLTFEREQAHSAAATSEQEEVQSDSLFTVWGSGFAWVGGKFFSMESSYQWRKDEKIDTTGIWLDTAISETHRYQAKIKNWRNTNGSLECQHYHKRFQNVEGEDRRTDVGELQAQNHALQRALLTDLLYSVSSSETRLRKEVYSKVDDNLGNYSYDPISNEYYPDPDGDYLREIILTQNTEPTTELKMSLRLQTVPKRYLQWKQKEKEKVDPADTTKSFWETLFKKIETATELRVEQQTRRDNLADLLFDPQFFQSDEQTIRGKFFYRQDVEILPDQRDMRFRLRYEMTNRTFNDTENNPREQQERQISTRAQSDYWEKISIEGRWNFEREKEVSQMRGLTRESTGHSIIGITTYNPTDSWKISLRKEWQGSNAKSRIGTELKPFNLQRISLIPTVTFNFKRTKKRFGRITAEINATFLSSDDDDVPYSILRQNRIGTNWRWRMDVRYNFNEYITGTLNYSATSRPDEETIHLGQMEVQAFF